MSAVKKLLTKSFFERLISGIILVLIALATIITGGDVLLATVVVISLSGCATGIVECDATRP